MFSSHHSVLAPHLGYTRRLVTFSPGRQVVKCISALYYAVQTEINLLMSLPRVVMRRKACLTPWVVDLPVGMATLLIIVLARNSTCTPNSEQTLCSLNSLTKIPRTLLAPRDLSGCVKKRKSRSMAPCHYCCHGSSARMRLLRSQSKNGGRVPPPYGARLYPSRRPIL